jgi:hypothetical protein
MAHPDCFSGRHVELSSSYQLTLSDYWLLLSILGAVLSKTLA